MTDPIHIFWFRRDLRFKDNHGLFQALTTDRKVLPIFIFDRNILDELEDRDDKRVTFIYQVISRLNGALARKERSIRCFYGKPLDCFKQLVAEYDIDTVFSNRDYEPYAEERDTAVAAFLKENGVAFRQFRDSVLREPGEVLTKSGDPYSVYTPFKRRWLECFSPEVAARYESEKHLSAFLEEKHEMPSLEDMGFTYNDPELGSPEIPADKLRNYDQNRDFPAADKVSRLGAHLRFGTLSIREALRQAREINDVWQSQLIWRDFFFQIMWFYPHVLKRAFRPEYDRIQWRNDEGEFEAWKQGKTGFPIVDAGMRQLAETGYMHNRVRMITASFLCKDLLIDWRWGEAWFARKLLDFEAAANNGNWQWAAGSGCDAAPYFRIFNPWTQADKFDPDQTYIKRWIPEIGTNDYPNPIVDHKVARERTLGAYKKALEEPKPEKPEPREPLRDPAHEL